jgi:hypothetical protein
MLGRMLRVSRLSPLTPSLSRALSGTAQNLLSGTQALSVASIRVRTATGENEPIKLMPLLAGVLAGALVSMADTSGCMPAKRKKKGSAVVDELYEVETIKARRLSKR